MYRSSSTVRVSDEFLVNMSPAGKGSPLPKTSASDDDLPTYIPLPDDASKKEIVYRSPGESAIHLIPVILVLCGLTLWFFSHSGRVVQDKIWAEKLVQTQDQSLAKFMAS